MTVVVKKTKPESRSDKLALGSTITSLNPMYLFSSLTIDKTLVWIPVYRLTTEIFMLPLHQFYVFRKHF